MDGYLTIIIVLITAVLCSSLWSLLTLRKLSKTGNNNNALTDPRYFELKYRIEFITTIVPIIILFLGFMGYKEVATIQQGVNSKIDEKVKPKFDSLDRQFNLLIDKQHNVRNDIDTSSQSLLQIQNRANAIEEMLARINSKDLIKQNIYVVSNLRITYNGDAAWKEYNFSEMKTISGSNLPRFSKPPLIISFNDKGTGLLICDVSNKHFFGQGISGMGGDIHCAKNSSDPIDFSIVIIEQ